MTISENQTAPTTSTIPTNVFVKPTQDLQKSIASDLSSEDSDISEENLKNLLEKLSKDNTTSPNNEEEKE